MSYNGPALPPGLFAALTGHRAQMPEECAAHSWDPTAPFEACLARLLTPGGAVRDKQYLQSVRLAALCNDVKALKLMIEIGLRTCESVAASRARTGLVDWVARLCLCAPDEPLREDLVENIGKSTMSVDFVLSRGAEFGDGQDAWWRRRCLAHGYKELGDRCMPAQGATGKASTALSFFKKASELGDIDALARLAHHVLHLPTHNAEDLYSLRMDINSCVLDLSPTGHGIHSGIHPGRSCFRSTRDDIEADVATAVTHDYYDFAVRELERSAQEGNKISSDLLGRLALRLVMFGGEQNAAEARRLMTLSYFQGNMYGTFAYFLVLFNGWMGVKKDLKRAAVVIHEAVADGFVYDPERTLDGLGAFDTMAHGLEDAQFADFAVFWHARWPGEGLSQRVCNIERVQLANAERRLRKQYRRDCLDNMSTEEHYTLVGELVGFGGPECENVDHGHVATQMTTDPLARLLSNVRAKVYSRGCGGCNRVVPVALDVMYNSPLFDIYVESFTNNNQALIDDVLQSKDHTQWMKSRQLCASMCFTRSTRAAAFVWCMEAENPLPELPKDVVRCIGDLVKPQREWPIPDPTAQPKRAAAESPEQQRQSKRRNLDSE